MVSEEHQRAKPPAVFEHVARNLFHQDGFAAESTPDLVGKPLGAFVAQALVNGINLYIAVGISRVHHPLPIAQVYGEHDHRLRAVFSQPFKLVEPLNRHATFEFSKWHARRVQYLHRHVGELTIETSGHIGSPCGISVWEGVFKVSVDDFGPVSKHALQQERHEPRQTIFDGQRQQCQRLVKPVDHVALQ